MKNKSLRSTFENKGLVVLENKTETIIVSPRGSSWSLHKTEWDNMCSIFTEMCEIQEQYIEGGSHDTSKNNNNK